MATDLTPAGFRAEYPDFPSEQYSDESVKSMLSLACQITSVSNDATYACCAHLLVAAKQAGQALDGGSGEIRGEGVGPLRREFKTVARTERETFFSTSRHGRLMLTLERASPRGIFSVVVGQ